MNSKKSLATIKNTEQLNSSGSMENSGILHHNVEFRSAKDQSRLLLLRIKVHPPTFEFLTVDAVRVPSNLERTGLEDYVNMGWEPLRPGTTRQGEVKTEGKGNELILRRPRLNELVVWRPKPL